MVPLETKFNPCNFQEDVAIIVSFLNASLLFHFLNARYCFIFKSPLLLFHFLIALIIFYYLQSSFFLIFFYLASLFGMHRLFVIFQNRFYIFENEVDSFLFFPLDFPNAWFHFGLV